MSTRISLSVTSDDPGTIARATEHFARTVTGLALDGMDCILFEHAKQLRATSYAMRARRLWLDVVIGWNQGAAERLERRVRLHRRRERRARDEYSKTPTTSAKCCICGEAASRVFQTPGLRACGQTPYCDQHAADLLARANRPRPTSTTARCAPQRRGCCTLCEGTGGEGAGACWDCRGTGHPHRPDPGCCERVRR